MSETKLCMHPDSLHAADHSKAVTVLYVLLWYLKQVLFVICIACSVINNTEQKKKRPMHFSTHFGKSTHFSDIARYVYYVTEIRLPDALICCFFISTNCGRASPVRPNAPNHIKIKVHMRKLNDKYFHLVVFGKLSQS